MFRWTRLPNEHAAIRFGFESADMTVGATTYGHQNRTSDNENRGGGIRRRCHEFCEGTCRHSNNWGPPTDLRKGNGCSFEHPKIQSYGGRLVGHIDGHDGLLLLSGNNHTCPQVREYSSPFTECHLVEGNGESQSPGERRGRSGLLPKTTNPLRA